MDLPPLDTPRLSETEKRIITLLTEGHNFAFIAAHCKLRIDTVTRALANARIKFRDAENIKAFSRGSGVPSPSTQPYFNRTQG